MRVKDAIKQLEELPEDEEIIIAYWRMEWFEDVTENIGYVDEDVPPMTEDEWKRLVAICEDEMGWEWASEDIEGKAIDNWKTIRPQE